jgi:hypothetical protein
MNARFANRAARVLLAAGTIAAGLGVATPAHANFCSPQPTPTIGSWGKGVFYEHESITFNLELTNPSCTNVSVDLWTSNESALSGSDYVGIAKVRVIFTPGQTLKKFVIAGVNDQVQEGLESFKVNVANPAGATILPTTTKRIFIDGTEAQ